MTSGQVAPAAPGLRHDANDVVQFVFDDGSGHEEADGYSPEMCHQIFGQEEEIVGHPEPSATIHFTPKFHSYVDFESGGPAAADATDVVGLLKAALGADAVSTNRDTFEAVMESEGELPISELGTPVVLPSRDTEAPAAKRRRAALAVTVLASKLSEASQELRALHARLQPLLLFYIDAASMVDQDDASWELFLAIADTKAGPRVAGFATLYRFFSWPDAKRLRVSQVCVLPPFQKNGTGAQLLAAAAEHAKITGAIDVTYEDPTEALQRLRDRLDLRRGRDSLAFAEALRQRSEQLQKVLESISAEAASGSAALSEATVKEIARLGVAPPDLVAAARKELQLCKQQVQNVWEALLYETASATNSEAAEDLLRTAVKARLSAAVSAAEHAAQGKLIEDAETGFVLRKRRAVERAALNPSVPVEEATREAKLASIDDAVEDRVNSLLQLVQ